MIKKLLLGIFFCLIVSQAQAVTVQVTSCPWTVPSNYTAGTVELIGGGGGGTAGNTSTGEAGVAGGAGAYVKNTSVSLTPNSSVPCQIGASGAAGASGTDT